MKKIVCAFLVGLLCFSFASCASNNNVISDPYADENIVVRSSETDDKTLEFSKNSREQSVQLNQKDSKWAVYSSLPSDVIIERSEFVTDTSYWIMTPAWTKYSFENTDVFADLPNYVMYTFGTEELDYKEITIKNSIPIKDLVDWKEESSEECVINGKDVTISTGKCYLNNNVHNEKEYAMAYVNGVDIHGCVIAITEECAFHTLKDIKVLVKDMAASLTTANEPFEINEETAELDEIQSENVND